MAAGWGALPPLLASLVLCWACLFVLAAPPLDAAGREEAFIGYSEQVAARSAAKCVNTQQQCKRCAVAQLPARAVRSARQPLSRSAPRSNLPVICSAPRRVAKRCSRIPARASSALPEALGPLRSRSERGDAPPSCLVNFRVSGLS